MAKFSSTLSLMIIVSLLSAIFSCTLSKNKYSNKNAKSDGVRLELIHIDSPKSPMYQPGLTHLERTQRSLAISESRIQYLTKKTSQAGVVSRYNEQAYVSPVSLIAQGYEYYVDFGLGKLADGTYYNVSLSFDTGSDMTWTQCDGCVNCFPQRDQVYSMTSRTWQPMPCDHCYPNRCWAVQEHCMYGMSYGAGLSVQGILSMDTLTFKSDFFTPNVPSIRNFGFVCATQTDHFLSGYHPGNVITGILGMGNGYFSFTSQLNNLGFINNKIFSYCLNAFSDDTSLDMPMFLRLGDAVESLPGMSVTPLVKGPNEGYYYVILHDISLDGMRLEIPSELFAVQNGGTIFDSGTVLSVLVPQAYYILEAHMSTYLTNYYSRALKRHASQVWPFTACWEPLYDSPMIRIPSLTFHFEGNVDIIVEPAQVMYIMDEMEGIPAPGLYCLRVTPTDGVNIIGSLHHTKHLMIFDVGNSNLHFIKNDSML